MASTMPTIQMIQFPQVFSEYQNITQKNIDKMRTTHNTHMIKSHRGIPVLFAMTITVAAVTFSPAFGQGFPDGPETISPIMISSVYSDEIALDISGEIIDIDVFSTNNGTYALIASMFGTHIIDVTEPDSPAIVAHMQNGQNWPHYGGSGPVGIINTHDNVYAITTNSEELQIIDVTNPETPKTVTSIKNGQDNRYVLRHLSQDESDSILEQYPGAEDRYYSWDMITDIKTHTDESGNTYAFLAGLDYDIVHILDVTVPQTPILVNSIQDGLDGFYALSHPQSIEIVTVSQRTYMIVSSFGDNAIQIIDITDMSNPQNTNSIRDGQDGTYSLVHSSEVETFVASGNVYALVIGYGSMQIIDITNPNDVKLAHTIQGGQDGVFDMANPEGIEIFTIHHNTYVLVSSSSGIQIIDITDPNHTTLVHSIQNGQDDSYYPFLHTNMKVFTMSDSTYALISEGIKEGAIQILDVTDPKSPEQIASIPVKTHILPFRIGFADMSIFTTPNNTYALLTDSNNDALKILNVTEPKSPTLITGIPYRQDGLSYESDKITDTEIIDIDGTTYALLSSGEYGMVQILDITNPDKPQHVIDVWDGSGNLATFTDSDNVYALLDSESSLQIINITNPATASTISGTRATEAFFPEYANIEVFKTSGGTYALTTPRFGHQVWIADITDIQEPVFLDPIEVEPNRFGPVFLDPIDTKVFAAHNRVYALIAGYDNFGTGGAVQILDITRPNTATLMATIVGGQDGFGRIGIPIDVEVFTTNDAIYALVVDYGFGSDGSLHVIDMTEPANPLPVYTIYSNDDNGFDLMDDPSDVDTFVTQDTTYALISNPSGSVLQIISLATHHNHDASR